MVITDATNKINQIPNSVLAQFGYTREGLIRKQEKENAAILMCGGLLGDCYLMAEVVDWLLTSDSLYENILKAKWCKQTIKHKFKTAVENLRKNIACSRNNSPTNPEYMMNMADSLYDELKPDLLKLTNSVVLELGKNKIQDVQLISKILVIDMLLQWITNYYDNTIKYMKNEIFSDADYNSWYYQARMTGASKWWAEAVLEFGKKHIDKVIDLNESEMIKNGITIIDKKMKDSNLSEKLCQINSDTEEGEGRELYNNALKTLGLVTDKPKALPKSSKPKKIKSVVPIEEQVEVENIIKERLSQKYTVK